MTTTALASAFRAGRAVMRGQLPDRYEKEWLEPFHRLAYPIASRPGARILDLGSGRAPAIPAESRSPDCWYVGLDVSPEELARAPTGAYDKTVVADATLFQPELRGQFDLIVSWQVLEHVKPLGQALDNMHGYLRPNGRLVAMLSGKFSPFALLNRVIPHRVGAYVVERQMGKTRDAVFPAFYDGCYYNALTRMLDGWRQHEILPEYRAAQYFDFWRVPEAACIVYEEWARLSGRANLATHYLISASR
jgi:SAM-dependent methyltransferase